MKLSRMRDGSRSVVSTGFWVSIRHPISQGPSSFSDAADQFGERILVGRPGALRQTGGPRDADDIGALRGHGHSGRR